MKIKLKTFTKNVAITASKEKIAARLEVVDIDSIKPWEKNPKKYKKKIDEVAESIRQYGQRTPVSVWTADDQVYKGNNTWYAMKKLGYKKIAVIWQDFEDEREAISYALIDNKTGEDQEWDLGILTELLQSETFQGLNSSEIGKLTGFEDKELKGLLLSTGALPDILPDVDLDGSAPDKADFFVIQFKDRNEMQAFKKRLGFETKHPRVVPYEDLLTVMEWKNEERDKAIRKIYKLKRR